jgi:hypothetical protein
MNTHTQPRVIFASSMSDHDNDDENNDETPPPMSAGTRRKRAGVLFFAVAFVVVIAAILFETSSTVHKVTEADLALREKLAPVGVKKAWCTRTVTAVSFSQVLQFVSNLGGRVDESRVRFSGEEFAYIGTCCADVACLCL